MTSRDAEKAAGEVGRGEAEYGTDISGWAEAELRVGVLRVLQVLCVMVMSRVSSRGTGPPPKEKLELRGLACESRGEEATSDLAAVPLPGEEGLKGGREQR